MTKRGRLRSGGMRLALAAAFCLAATAPPLALRASAQEAPAQARLNALVAAGDQDLSRQNMVQADKAYREALGLARKLFPANHPELLAVLGKAATSAQSLGNWAEHEKLAREATAMRRSQRPVPEFELALGLTGLGVSQLNQGKIAEAQASLRDSAGILDRIAGPDHILTLSTRTSLAMVQMINGNWDAGMAEFEANHRSAVKKHGVSSFHALTVEVIMATAQAMIGRDAEAEAAFRRIVAQTTGKPNMMRNVLENALGGLGQLLAQQGRRKEAEAIHRQLIALAEEERGKGHPYTASPIADLADDLAARGDLAEADRLIDQAIAIARKGNARSISLVRFLGSKAEITRRRGQLAKAYEFHQQALAAGSAVLGPRSLMVAGSQDRLGKVALEMGKPELAERHFRAAVEIARTSSANQTEPMANLAGVTRDPREALELARASVANSRARRARLAGGGGASRDAQAAMRATMLDRIAADPRSYPYLRLVEVAWKASAAAGQNKAALRGEAFLAAQDAYLSRAAQAMARTAIRAAATKGKLGELVREQQDLSTKLGVWQDRQLEAIGKGEDEAAKRYFALAEEGGARLGQIDAEIEKRFPEFRTMLNPAPMTLGEVTAALRPGEGLLLIVTSLDGVASFAAGPAGSAWHRANLSKQEIAAIQRRMLCQLDDANCTDPAAAKSSRRGYDLLGAHRLYAEIVKPVEGALAGVNRLYVVSQGEFGRLPLGLLPTAIPAKAGASADGAAIAGSAWLADRYAMITLPSVASLRLAGKVGKPAPQAFVGYGAPVLRGTPPSAAELARSAPSGGLADIALLHGLKPLPATAQELQAQAASLGSNAKALRLGRAASEAAVRADKALGQARVITFATHSLMAGELEGFDEPGLVFSPPQVATPQDDGVLSASEAATLSLNADWVILSACNTAAGAEGAEALSGLARAFLFAGARSLLVSHWGLKDQATAALTVEALREDRALSRGAALQAAMKTMRTGKRADGSALEGWRPYWAHPAYWAGFSLIANSDQ